VLGAEKIGINDNFFELGGHSLKATSMAAKIHKELSVEVPLKEIFRVSTIKGVSEYIKGQEKNIFKRIEPVEEKEYYELSPAQKRLYTLWQFEPEGTGYNIPGVLEIEGKLDAGKLEDVFRKLVERHEALRTSFELIGEEIVQKIHKKIKFEIEYKEAKEEAAEGIIRSFIRPFDLSKAPLFRVGLVKLHPEKYILMYDMHHIISDGTSAGIMVDEFVKLYEGQELPSLRLQYKDYAAWQNGMLESEAVKQQEEYWLEVFNGEIPVLELPTDIKRPAVQSFEGDKIDFELDEEVTKGLRNIVRETGATMYMVMLAGFNILLSKYSGQQDIVVGSPVAGRPHADLENIMGMFVNTLAMRNYPEDGKIVGKFIEEIKENALRAYENQYYQFEELVEKLDIRRDMSRNPVFDVMFAMQNMDIGEIAITGISVKPYAIENHVSKFDITVGAQEAGDKLSIGMEYSTKLFSKETIERMAAHFTNVLWDIAGNIDKKISEIELLDEEERHKLLYEFNDTYAEYPKDKTIHEQFEEQAEKTPDNVAVVYEDKYLTYRELNEKSNQLARVLREKGVVSDSIAAIMAERSLDMIVGIMGILKAGGAYLPIDPEYPKDRIEHMLKDSSASILLTQKHLRGKAAFDGEAIELDSEQLYAGDSSNLEAVNKTDNLAYVIYTSGSTGKPKGVMIEHKSISNTINWKKQTHSMGINDIVLPILSYTFDAFTAGLLTTLISGACIIILNNEDIRNPHVIVQKLKKYNVTHLISTPAIYSTLLDSCEEDAAVLLKAVTLGGDRISDDIPVRSKQKFKAAKIHNEYGPTENSVVTASKADIKPGEDITIGKPISNTKVFILDKNNKIQPAGVAGELCIGGDGLARGYLGRPELTAEKFASNPFEPGKRMYKTGDLVRWLPDGNIEFLGRIDDQVKIRGYRIELGEIESRLLMHPDIKEAAVVAREDKNSNKYVCAYIAGEKELVLGELREHLCKELPEYMIPSYFVQLGKMPLTPNGKIDRKALPEPGGNMVAGAGYEAPRNVIEEKLVSIWQEVLEAEKIGIGDNFFELGGHSLKATSMAAKIYKQLNTEVPLKEIFKTPTIKGIAEYINSTEESKYTAIEKADKKEYYRVSSSQKRIYTIQQSDLDSTGYNMPAAVELEGRTDKEKLQETFRKLVERHEAFRTSFEIVEKEIVQKIHETVDFEIEYIDKTGQAYKEQDIAEDIKKFVRAFELNKAPLIRAGLIRCAEDKHILMFDMHHIITDGTSMSILVSEFTRLYNGENLSELRIQYKDYAEWHNKLLATDYMKKQEDYWLKQFEGEIPVLNMATDYPRPHKQSLEGSSIQFELESGYLEKLKKLALETGSTLYMVLLAAYNVILSKYTNQEDIIVGSPIAGRPHADLSGIVGVFINTLAMRNFPERNKTFKEFILEVKENALKVYENQDYQFDKLIEKLNIRRDLSRNPLFDTMFVLHNIDMQEITANGPEFKPYNFENGTSKFDITLTASEEQGQAAFNLEYSTKLFKEDTIKQFSVHFTNVLKQIAENPEDKLSAIDVLTDEEKRTILSAFNNTQAQYPKDKTIHALFEEQVEKTPGSTALIFRDEALTNKTLTYKELNDRSDHLARILRGKGVKSDSIVGIMLDRSLEMMIAIMGILKAGGAYLPIDPGYPKDRISYMLSDSKAPVLITQEKYKEHFEFKGDVILKEVLMQSGEESTNFTEASTPENLAYVIYTSGSTGKPKGVMIEHRAVNNFIKGMTDLIEFAPDKTILALTTISFDIFVLETLLPLTKGMKVVIADEKEQKDAALLSEVIKTQHADMLQVTPSRIQMLLNDKKSTDCLEGVRTLMVGGEALPETLLKEIKQVFRGRIYNMYGPTETTVWSTVKELTKEDRISIGKPIANTMVYITDSSMMPVPVGVPGEFYIGGDGLARGYLNNPELTKERFIENPFIHGGRIYRTGDLARWLSDGNIEFLGRIDQQVKIRGYRIELGEIESAINEQEGVVEAVVYVRESRTRNQYLCAYLVVDKTDVQSIKNNLKKKLPEYMLPTSYIIVDKIPLTPNGKVDRQALLDIQRPEDIQNKMPPRNFHDSAIADIWKEVLGLEEVYIHDDFFEIGGNSINIIQVAYQIKEILGVEITAADLMAYRTVHELSDYITSGVINQNGKYKCVFKINKSKSPKNIFIIHGGDANIYYYRHLAKLLEDEYSVYGIQPRGLNGEEPFPESYFEMLHDYIGEIRMIQEEGPYIIVGYCIGGYLCNDIENIFRIQGDKVAATIQLDEEAFIEKRHLKGLYACRTLLKIIDFWRRIARKDKMYTLEKFMNLIPKDKPPVTMEKQREILKDRESLRHYFQVDLPINSHYFFLGFPQSPTLVIKAIDNNNPLFTKELWEKMARGPLEYYEVPGDHETVLLPPYVDKVAEIVREFLSYK